MGSLGPNLITGATHSSGLYEIRCTVSGKLYIGSSENVLKRLWAHVRHLRRNEHSNPHLQRAWNLHGEDAFTFQQVLTCPVGDIRKEEQARFGLYPWESLYNIAKDAHRGAGKWGRLGKQNTSEHNQAIGRGNKGKPNPRKGQHHGWGWKASNTQTAHNPYWILAKHEDGRMMQFGSPAQAAKAVGVSRTLVRNILAEPRRTRTGWTFCLISKE